MKEPKKPDTTEDADLPGGTTWESIKNAPKTLQDLAARFITGVLITGGKIQTAVDGLRLRMNGDADKQSYEFLADDLVLAELKSMTIPDSGNSGAALRHGTNTILLGISGQAEGEGERSVGFMNAAGDKYFVFVDHDDGTFSIETNVAVNGISTIPTGTMMDYAGAVAPSGWALCDGSAVLRSGGAYDDLYALIGTTYGVGNGTTTFNLPDRRGKVSVAAKSGDADFGTEGAALGEKTHVLTTTEMPSHSHPGTYGFNVWNQDGVNGSTKGQGISSVPNVTPGITPQGGGGAHNNIQPTLVVGAVIIKL